MSHEQFRKPLVGKRFPAGSHVDGRWVQPPAAEFSFTASVQPARGKDMQMLPENRRSQATYVLYTSTPLLTVDEAAKQQPDQVILHDGVYEVVAVEPWQNNVIPHYRAMVQKPPVSVQ